MKKMVLCLIMSFFAMASFAQETGTTSGNSQWLTEFNEIDLSGPFTVVIEQIPDTEAPRIVVDTKGSYTSKFSYEVKNKVLNISEKYENKRMTVTEVKVFCHQLDKIRISGATVSFAAPLKAVMLDAVIGGGAVVTLPVGLTDLKMDVSGKSRVVLSGDTRYLLLSVSTAQIDALQLNVMSAMVEATNKAEISLNVSERIDAKVSTGGRITFAGDPAIVRKSVGFTGGDIIKAQ